MFIEDRFLIRAIPGYSPRIGELIVMMEYARTATIHAVQHLTQDDLDARPAGVTNSIGMLLEHIAEVEIAYAIDTFEGKVAPDTPGLILGESAQESIRGNEAAHYIDRLRSVRDRTLIELAKRDDAWLSEVVGKWGRSQVNNHFKWFHVMEDELGHCGQIRLLRRLLTSKVIA